MPCNSEQAMATIKKKNDSTTEEKIIAAARKLFTQQGFNAVKTRDIAKESGINLALLNYYFRSKEKLFEMVMQENMQYFFSSVLNVVNDEETSIKQKIERLVNTYLDMLALNPELPLFVMSHLRNNVNPQRNQFQGRLKDSYFMKQIVEAIKRKEIAAIHPANIVINIVALSIFPYIGKPMLKNGHILNDAQFADLMEERRKLIPKWIEAMMQVK